MNYRILLVISNLEFGGAQRQIVEVVNNIDTEIFNIFICSLSDYIPLAKHLNSSHYVHIIKKKFKYDISVVSRLVHLLNELKIDIVHSYLFDADIAARIAGKIANIPVIINSERNTNYHLKYRQLLTYRLTNKFVDAFIANSHVGATFNQKKLGHSSSIYSVIHNGVDTNYFKPLNVDDLRLELGLTKSNKVIGMFASFKEQKNHPLFFRTAQKLLSKIPEAKFLLVGDILYRGMHGSSAYATRINNLVDHLGLSESCIFLGNRSDVDRLYNVCDITLLTSLFEGTPNVLLESMACGVPVVATDVADNALIVQNGISGYIVSLDDEEQFFQDSLRLLTNCELRTQVSKAARIRMVQEFSTERMARKTEAVYLKLLHNSLKTGCAVSGPAINSGFLVQNLSQKEKITVVFATHFPDILNNPIGGVESVSVSLVLALKEYQDLDLHVVTFSYDIETLTIEVQEGYTIHRLPANKGSKLLNIFLKNRKVFCNYVRDKIKPDFVHAHDTYGILASSLDIPKVLTIHGFIHKDTALTNSPMCSIRAFLWKLLEKSNWKKFRFIISISPYVRHTLQKIYQPQLFEIENPVPPKFFHIERKEHKFVIFSAAEISPRKNTLNLVKAFKLLLAGDGAFELRLAGNGWETRYGQMVQDFITCHQMDDSIILLGQVSVEGVIEELSYASVFALVSYEENAPMGIEEAMAAGLPIVTSNCCGMPYMVENEKSGFLVNPYDPNDIASALRKIFENDTLKRSMGIRSKALALEKFTSLRIARKTHEVYFTILNQK